MSVRTRARETQTDRHTDRGRGRETKEIERGKDQGSQVISRENDKKEKQKGRK